MMKILEAEQWQKSANLHEVVLLQQQQEEDKIDSTTVQKTKSASSPPVRLPERVAPTQILPVNTGAPHLELERRKGTINARKARHGYCPGDGPIFKGGFPHSRPEASWARSPPMRTRVPTL